MGTILISLGSAGAAAGGSFALASVPEWIFVVIAILGVAAIFGVVAMLGKIRDLLPTPEKSTEQEFTRMLCDQIWVHTDHIDKVFAQRLRLPPADIGALRILVRHLREDLGGPMNFVEQMRSQRPDGWHSYKLFQAFNNWGGQLSAVATQLSDFNQAINYPLVRDPVDKHRDAVLVHQYLIEQAFLDRAVDSLRGHAFDFCAAARKILARKKKPGEEEEEDHNCPCCKRGSDHAIARRDPLQPIMVPAPPLPPPPAPVVPKPPSPPPATALPPVMHICLCSPPTMCRCRACTCSCACVTVAVPAPVAAAPPVAVPAPIVIAVPAPPLPPPEPPKA